MFAKKIVGVLATALVGLTAVVGCQSAKSDPSTGMEEALTESADGLLSGALQKSAPARAQKGPVTCSGDQNNGGRICCDDTHCCININGTINCNLPGPRRVAR